MSNDPINPAHYNRFKEHEPIDVISEWDLNYNLGNVVKYISRAGYKEGNTRLIDLQKALWYLEREIENEQKADTDHDPGLRVGPDIQHDDGPSVVYCSCDYSELQR